MSEELKQAAVYTANVFLPGSLGPVRREVVLAYEHDRVVDQLRAELAALKAGQGEAVAIAECREVHGHMCQFLNRTQHGMDTLRDGDKLYTAPPASADARLVPVELLELCFEGFDDYWVASPEGVECTGKLRALLARRGVKS